MGNFPLLGQASCPSKGICQFEYVGIILMRNIKGNGSKYPKPPMPTYWRLFIVAILSIIAFLVLLVPVLNWLNNFVDTPFGHWFTIKNGVLDWFAFWGSFSGAIAAVLVGIATIRLTEFQVQLSVATGMPQMTCKDMKIYSVNRSQVKVDYLSKFVDINNYCIVFNLTPCFPPYFDISIDSIQLMTKTHSKILPDIIRQPLEKGKHYFLSNNELFELFINIPTNLDSIVEHFYLLNLETTNATLYENKSIQITLRFKCSNALLHASVFNKGEVYFDMMLTMESEGKSEDCVKFRTNDIKFVRAERRRIERWKK